MADRLLVGGSGSGQTSSATSADLTYHSGGPSSKTHPYRDAMSAAQTQAILNESYVDSDLTDEEYGAASSEQEMTEEEMAEVAAESGLHVSDLTGIFSQVSQQILDERLDVWGFVVIKTWGFGSDSAYWDKFWGRWQQFMDSHLRTLGMTGNLRTGLAGKLTWHLVEAEGAAIEEVRTAFDETVRSGKLPVGMELDLCLAIDEASARTLLNPREGVVPYVTGVMSERARQHAGNDGNFKIAMDMLVPDVWYLLSEASPGQIDPGNGVMYRGALTADADGGTGKRELIPLS